MGEYFKRGKICFNVIGLGVVISLLITSLNLYFFDRYNVYGNIVEQRLTDLLPTIRPKLKSCPLDLPVIKGIQFDDNRPFNLDFYFDTMNKGEVNQKEIDRLTKYFLGFLAIPSDKLWVNLSPNEPDRIIPEPLSRLNLGKDLLIEDYLLKQITSALTDPQTKLGKQFWQEVYKAAQNVAQTTRVPINNFYKIWIVPDKAEVCEYRSQTEDQRSQAKYVGVQDFVLKDNTNQNKTIAFVKEAKLKVMLEEDFCNNVKQPGKGLIRPVPDRHNLRIQGTTLAKIHQINNEAKEIFKRKLLPIIEEKVNKGIEFAPLRQLYYSLILAAYFKRQLLTNNFYRNYFNQEKVALINSCSPQTKQLIYNSYLKSFRQGMYNNLSRNYDPYQEKQVRRQYFSGGAFWTKIDSQVKVSRTSNYHSFLGDFNVLGQLVRVTSGVVAKINGQRVKLFSSQGSKVFGSFIPFALKNKLPGQDYFVNMAIYYRNRYSDSSQCPLGKQAVDWAGDFFREVCLPYAHLTGFQEQFNQALRELNNSDRSKEMEATISWLTSQGEEVLKQENIRVLRINQLQSEQRKLVLELEKVNEDLSVKNIEFKKLQEERNQDKADLEKAQEYKKAVESKQKQLSEQLEELQRNEQQNKSNLEKAQQEKRNFEQRLEQLQRDGRDQISQLTQRSGQLTKEKDAIQKQLKQANDELSRLKKFEEKNKNLETHIGILIEAKEQAETKLQKIEKSSGALQQEKQTVEDRVKALQEECQKKDRDLKEAGAQRQKLEGEIKKLQQQQKQDKQALEEQLQKVKKDLEARQRELTNIEKGRVENASQLQRLEQERNRLQNEVNRLKESQEENIKKRIELEKKLKQAEKDRDKAKGKLNKTAYAQLQEEYDKLVEQFQSVDKERRNYESQYLAESARLSHKEEEIKELQAQIKKKEREKENLETQLKELQEKYALLLEERDSLNSQVTVLTTQIDDLTQEKKQLQQSLEGATRERDLAVKIPAGLRNALGALQTKFDQKEVEVKQAALAVSLAQNQLKEALQKVEPLQKQIAELERQRQQEQERVTALTQRIGILEEKLAQVNAMLISERSLREQVQQEKIGLQQEIQVLEANYVLKEGELKQVEQELRQERVNRIKERQNLRAQLTERNQEISMLQKREQELQDEIQRLNIENNKLSQQFRQANVKIAQLEYRNSYLTEEQSRLKSQLEEKDKLSKQQEQELEKVRQENASQQQKIQQAAQNEEKLTKEKTAAQEALVGFAQEKQKAETQQQEETNRQETQYKQEQEIREKAEEKFKQAYHEFLVAYESHYGKIRTYSEQENLKMEWLAYKRFDQTFYNTFLKVIGFAGAIHLLSPNQGLKGFLLYEKHAKLRTALLNSHILSESGSHNYNFAMPNNLREFKRALSMITDLSEEQRQLLLKYYDQLNYSILTVSAVMSKVGQIKGVIVELRTLVLEGVEISSINLDSQKVSKLMVNLYQIFFYLPASYIENLLEGIEKKIEAKILKLQPDIQNAENYQPFSFSHHLEMLSYLQSVRTKVTAQQKAELTPLIQGIANARPENRQQVLLEILEDYDHVSVFLKCGVDFNFLRKLLGQDFLDRYLTQLANLMPKNIQKGVSPEKLNLVVRPLDEYDIPEGVNIPTLVEAPTRELLKVSLSVLPQFGRRARILRNNIAMVLHYAYARKTMSYNSGGRMLFLSSLSLWRKSLTKASAKDNLGGISLGQVENLETVTQSNRSILQRGTSNGFIQKYSYDFSRLEGVMLEFFAVQKIRKGNLLVSN